MNKKYSTFTIKVSSENETENWLQKFDPNRLKFTANRANGQKIHKVRLNYDSTRTLIYK